MSRVSIQLGTIRDVSWIVSHLRPLDQLEVDCQMSAPPAEMAYFLCNSPCYVAYLDDRPSMAFGYAKMTDCGVSVWALGTGRAHRCAPAITRFFRQKLVPRMWAEGIRWGEVRSIATHTVAHRWLFSTGAEAVLRLPDYGKGGEEFILFRWLWRTFADEVPEIAARLRD